MHPLYETIDYADYTGKTSAGNPDERSYNKLGMRRTEKVAKWTIRVLVASPLFVILGGMEFLLFDNKAYMLMLLPAVGVALVCLAIHHAEVNYGIGWPSLIRILQTLLVLFVAYCICLGGLLGLRGFGNPEYMDSAFFLLKFLSPIFLLFLAPRRSLFERWPRPGEYDGN